MRLRSWVHAVLTGLLSEEDDPYRPYAWALVGFAALYYGAHIVIWWLKGRG